MQTPFKRPSWDEYFMKMTEMAGSRGTCDRGRSGCVITKDKRIISTGYVGSPIDTMHCDEAGHEMHTVTHPDGSQSRHCIRTTHAEQNAICQAARVGIALEGATLYCKMTPCYTCAKMIINSGIKRVVCENDYHAGKRSKEIFAESGVQFKLLNPEMVTYADMKPQSTVSVKVTDSTPEKVITPIEVKVLSNSVSSEAGNTISAEIPL
jgi:dCMP deaminase